MTRPLRLEFPNALYHVTSRGDRREAIFEDDEDRLRFLEILGMVVLDHNWLCHGYCLMDNHYHLIIETLTEKQKGVRSRINMCIFNLSRPLMPQEQLVLVIDPVFCLFSTIHPRQICSL